MTDETKSKAKPRLKVTYHQEQNGDWRWTAVDSRNGKIVGASSEGYRKQKSVVHNAEMLLAGGYSPEFRVAYAAPKSRKRFRDVLLGR